jgi:hypothetical protein
MMATSRCLPSGCAKGELGIIRLGIAAFPAARNPIANSLPQIWSA